jgi:hypothetical protein
MHDHLKYPYFVAFYENRVKVGLRADSGFYGEEIFQYLEEKKGWREPINYHCLITNLTLPAQQVMESI